MDESSESNGARMELDPLDTDVEELASYCWTRKAIKLLIQLYQERQHQFRDPHYKKKDLWIEMAREMRKAGYHGLTSDSLDRKMRNMKKSYRNIKENKRKRLSWEYFTIFDQLFGEEWERSYNKNGAQAADKGEVKNPLKRKHRASRISYSEDTNDADTSRGMPGSPDSTEYSNHADPLYSSQWSNGAHEENDYLKGTSNEVQRRTEAIEKLAQRLYEANQIQVERNALLKQFLSKCK